MASALGHPEIFEKWLFDAAAGSLHAMAYLKDYGLIPETLDELKVTINEYAQFIEENKHQPRTNTHL